jgi:methylaspartate ammonia-lyase
VGVVQLLVDAKANLNGTIGVSTIATELQTALMLNRMPVNLFFTALLNSVCTYSVPRMLQ